MQPPGPWIVLLGAIVVEVFATILLKRSNGMTQPFFAVLAVFCYLLAIWLFSLVQRVLPMGIVYALWSGLGMVLVTIAARVFWSELIHPWGLLGMALIVLGAVILQGTSTITEKRSAHSAGSKQESEPSDPAP
jgi:multidrug transporter EmrE-like cation transporter